MLVEKSDLQNFSSDLLSVVASTTEPTSWISQLGKAASMQQNEHLRNALYSAIDIMKQNGISFLAAIKKFNDPNVFHPEFIDVVERGYRTPSPKNPAVRSLDILLREYIATS